MANSSESLLADILKEGISEGDLTMEVPGGREYRFGNPRTEPHARWIIRDTQLCSDLIRNPTYHLGNGYEQERYTVEGGTLVDFLGIFLRNNARQRVEASSMKWRVLVHWLLRSGQHLTRAIAERNINHHYDAGNDYYELLLSEDMAYSCGYQCKPEDCIEQMQAQKNELICRKIGLYDLVPERRRVADVGCGFGSTSRYIAKNFSGASVTGVTLSREQALWGKERAAAEGLSSHVNIMRGDYRDLRGQDPAVISIGMAEHAYNNPRKQSHDHGYDELTGTLSSLTENGGTLLIQTISTTDEPNQPTDDYFAKRIFPGGRLPRPGEIVTAATRQNLMLLHVENWRGHYAETLRHWSASLDRNEEQISRSYSPAFVRSQRYYLNGSEAGFRHGNLHLYQYLFAKGDRWQDHVPRAFDFGDPSVPHHTV